MVEFNPTLLATLILSGYKYMVYMRKGDHGVLHPIRKAYLDDEFLTSIGAWQIKITEREIQDMAYGEELIDFKFYVDESLFNDN